MAYGYPFSIIETIETNRNTMKTYQVIICGEYNLQLTIETEAQNFSEATERALEILQRVKAFPAGKVAGAQIMSVIEKAGAQ